MSAEKNSDEAGRWLETSRGDLETARILKAAGRWAHACFHAQQPVEKALKALWYAKDLDPWGHSAQRLFDDLAAASAETHRGVADLSIQAAEIDRFYIPTRYPNGLPDLTREGLLRIRCRAGDRSRRAHCREGRANSEEMSRATIPARFG
jgi:HEPN domain-containing protein